MGIKELLEHSWIEKFTKTDLTGIRKGTRQLSGNFEKYASIDFKQSQV